MNSSMTMSHTRVAVHSTKLFCRRLTPRTRRGFFPDPMVLLRCTTRPIGPGKGSFEMRYSALTLLEGYYKVSVAIFKPGGATPYDAFDFHPPHYPFRIQGEGKSHGIAFLEHEWSQP